MGSWIGHVAPGGGFLLFGLWHLFNHIKLHCLRPTSSLTWPAWFPLPILRLRYLEPALIMAGSSIFIVIEHFVGPAKHQPLDDDGTIPSYHLHNFEHAFISLNLFIYAAFAVTFDRMCAPARHSLTLLLAAAAFGQQLLLFHFHSTDHTSVEGQYHRLLEVVIFISLFTTLLNIACPMSFVLCFVRSASIAFQGVWLIVVGYALWTPEFVAKGCFMSSEDGHVVVRCHTDEALHRAKSLANIEFSWWASGFTVFAMLFYVFMVRRYRKDSPEYASLASQEAAMLLPEEEEVVVDMEGKIRKLEESSSFVMMARGVEAHRY